MVGLVVAAAALAMACSGGESGEGGGAFPASPYATIVSDAGTLRIEARTAPEQPPVRGTNRVELTVTDAVSGSPVDDLLVTVVPWMVAMGHGSSVTPTVVPEPQGKYLVTNVSLFMPGAWELRMSLSDGQEDRATLALDVR